MIINVKANTKYSGTSLKGHFLWSLQDHGNTILPFNEDNLLSNLYITAKKAGPRVSVI